MAYDEVLAGRVRGLLGNHPRLREQKMFGGLAFLIGGNMAIGILADTLMVRVGRDAYESALERPHTREMDLTGRPMRGFVLVDRPGIRSRPSLERWVDRGLEFAESLPAKPGS